MTPLAGIDGQATARARFPALGTTAAVLVTDASALPSAEAMLRGDLAALDLACSRFRADSEIWSLQRITEAVRTVSPLLAAVLHTALRAAELSDGAVNPTVGAAMSALGYDRDFAALPADSAADPPVPAPGWWRVGWTRTFSGGVATSGAVGAAAQSCTTSSTRAPAPPRRRVGGPARVRPVAGDAPLFPIPRQRSTLTGTDLMGH